MRQKAGLGDSLYTINDNEAENHLLKLKTDHKRVNLVTLIEKSHELVNEQDSLLEGAIIDQGECRLSDEYKHLKISPEKWRKMNPTERNSVHQKSQRKWSHVTNAFHTLHITYTVWHLWYPRKHFIPSIL